MTTNLFGVQRETFDADSDAALFLEGLIMAAYEFTPKHPMQAMLLRACWNSWVSRATVAGWHAGL